MKLRKVVFVFVIALFAIVALYTPGWSEEGFTDYADYTYDLLLARPAAFLGGIGGTAVFIVALPFTVASGSVKDSFNIFVAKPFWYAFVRKFPDEKSE